jgi:hypothetical protein
MSSGIAILERVIEPGRGDFSPNHARYVLSLGFSDEEQSLFQNLSAKAQSGTLTPDEIRELDAFLSANALLIILRSKARRSLARGVAAG